MGISATAVGLTVAPMRTFPATGISLIVYKYRGTGRVVVFFTRERGKVEAVARGVGKPGSKLASLVEPLTLSKLFLAKGRELDHLTEGDVINPFYGLRSNMRRFGYASYIAELTARATEPDLPMPQLFEALRASLEALEGGARPDIVTWGFALRLLEQLGVGPVLEQCVNCDESLTGQLRYSPSAGGLICGDCTPIDASADLAVSGMTAGLLRCVATFPLDRLSRLSCPPVNCEEIGQLVRRHIEYHLGFVPRSQRFIEEMEKFGERSDEGDEQR